MQRDARVLIVDDHEGFRRQARVLLERAGFTIAGEAADGAGALALIAAVQPDAVLLDVQLPDMNGFEVIAAMAATDRTDVVLISGRPAADYGERVAACAARGFLQKDELTAARFRDLLTPTASA